jgi:hypothetical protein
VGNNGLLESHFPFNFGAWVEVAWLSQLVSRLLFLLHQKTTGQFTGLVGTQDAKFPDLFSAA